ncbi:MAG TPA: hypothetical protein VGM90_35920 [Kofleriaceae bacterium]|jgi:hypothetical protein
MHVWTHQPRANAAVVLCTIPLAVAVAVAAWISVERQSAHASAGPPTIVDVGTK